MMRVLRVQKIFRSFSCRGQSTKSPPCDCWRFDYCDRDPGPVAPSLTWLDRWNCGSSSVPAAGRHQRRWPRENRCVRLSSRHGLRGWHGSIPVQASSRGRCIRPRRAGLFKAVHPQLLRRQYLGVRSRRSTSAAALPLDKLQAANKTTARKTRFLQTGGILGWELLSKVTEAGPLAHFSFLPSISTTAVSVLLRDRTATAQNAGPRHLERERDRQASMARTSAYNGAA
jgi:hypothetical protein